jgi:hypothetical protein
LDPPADLKGEGGGLRNEDDRAALLVIAAEYEAEGRSIRVGRSPVIATTASRIIADSLSPTPARQFPIAREESKARRMAARRLFASAAPLSMTSCIGTVEMARRLAAFNAARTN